MIHIIPGNQTLLEIAENAISAGVVLVERGGRMALCGVDAIPPGWHRVGAGQRAERKTMKGSP